MLGVTKALIRMFLDSNLIIRKKGGFFCDSVTSLKSGPFFFLNRCCTVNFPQGWPKFITNAFLTTPDRKSLVHLYLGPYSVSSTLASGQSSSCFSKKEIVPNLWTQKGNLVSVHVDTIYPFSDTLTTTITASSAFQYYVRIPGWVVGGTISINGGSEKAVQPSGNRLLAIPVSAGTTQFVLNLPANIVTGAYVCGGRGRRSCKDTFFWNAFSW